MSVSGELLAAAIEVHRILGPGFLESVYEHALCVELGLRNVQFRRQVPVRVEYKGHRVGEVASTCWFPIVLSSS